MATKIYTVDSLPARIPLGRQTENGARTIRIDCQPWRAEWPGLNVSIWVTPPGGGEPYPVAVAMDGDVAVWTVSNADTANAGEGLMEVVGLLDGIKTLSAIAGTYVTATTTTLPGTTPEAYQGWVEQVLAAGAEAAEAAELAAVSEQIATDAATRAEASAAAAAASEQAAAASEEMAEDHANSAAVSAKSASDAKDSALLAQGLAEQSAEAASAAMQSAAASADSASASAATAAEEAARAKTEADRAEASADMAAEYAAQGIEDIGELTSSARAAIEDDRDAALTDITDTGAAVLASIPADYTALAEAAKKHAPAIVGETRGGVVTVSDAAERPAVQVVSDIVAVQSGTGDPSPDNVRPIIGWDVVPLSRTRKNILGVEDFSITASTKAYTDTCTDGVFRREIAQYVTTSYAVVTNVVQYLKHPHIPAGTYTFTATYTSSTTYNGLYLEVTLPDGAIAKLPNGETTTIAQGGTITGVRMTSKGFTAGTVIELTMQLEAGAGTSYEPYSGATMTASLPETIYGGSLDWTTGVLTVTHIGQTLTGLEAWSMGASGTTYSFDNRTVQNKSLTDNNRAYHLCSHYKPAAYKSPADQADMTCYTLNSYMLYVKDTTAGTLDGFKAYLAAQAAAGTPVTLLWPLKPAYYTTVQITSQQLDMLKGYNTVWSDSGDTSLVYVADTKMYIDNAIAALAANIINA